MRKYIEFNKNVLFKMLEWPGKHALMFCNLLWKISANSKYGKWYDKGKCISQALSNWVQRLSWAQYRISFEFVSSHGRHSVIYSFRNSALIKSLILYYTCIIINTNCINIVYLSCWSSTMNLPKRYNKLLMLIPKPMKILSLTKLLHLIL